MLLQITDKKWYVAYRLIVLFLVSLSDLLRSFPYWYCRPSQVQLCSSWQNFNWILWRRAVPLRQLSFFYYDIVLYFHHVPHMCPIKGKHIIITCNFNIVNRFLKSFVCRLRTQQQICIAKSSLKRPPHTLHTCCCTRLWNITVRKLTIVWNRYTVINDNSQGSVATHLRCSKIFMAAL